MLLRRPERVTMVLSTCCSGKFATSETVSSFSAPGSEVVSEMARTTNVGGYGEVSPITLPVNFWLTNDTPVPNMVAYTVMGLSGRRHRCGPPLAPVQKSCERHVTPVLGATHVPAHNDE